MKTGTEFTAPKERREYPSKCLQCGGSVAVGIVTLTYSQRDGQPRLVHGVPVGICTTCGKKYVSSEVARKVERSLSQPPARTEEVLVWDFAETA